jgi:DNA-binding HxlR family transcriptional regulator
MDNQRQREINRAHQYLADKMLARELKRLDRVYYCIVTLVVTTTLGSLIAYINSIWSV